MVTFEKTLISQAGDHYQNSKYTPDWKSSSWKMKDSITLSKVEGLALQVFIFLYLKKIKIIFLLKKKKIWIIYIILFYSFQLWFQGC